MKDALKALALILFLGTAIYVSRDYIAWRWHHPFTPKAMYWFRK